ncbi:BnaC09g24080D [Brassica napus]|uniref:BnaC09g24080D protein n=2 Tax=Brassica TaxID=3705 RepID=A0A078FLT9_BRANA|nr:BnaC09g24080D [Brassica napus]VDD31051.1 unnamed protein product [Brassica oleracea]
MMLMASRLDRGLLKTLRLLEIGLDLVRHELGQRQESLLRFRSLGISNGLMLLMFLSSRGYKNLIGISIISLHTIIMDEDKANSKTPNIS